MKERASVLSDTRPALGKDYDAPSPEAGHAVSGQLLTALPDICLTRSEFLIYIFTYLAYCVIVEIHNKVNHDFSI